jgi:hypothetical protein
MSENNRVTALTLAAHDNGSADEIVARATTYLAFLDAANPNVAPGETPKRRGRPSKDEAPAAAPAPVPEPAPAPAAQIDIFGDDKTEAPVPVEITRDDLRAALVAAQKATDAATVLAVMKSIAKAETLGAVAKEFYGPLKAAADKIIASKVA